MVHEAIKQFREEPTIKIYETIKGKKGFKLAQDMLNWNEAKQYADDKWASKWSDEEKKKAVFFLIGKKKRVNEDIGFKLFVGEGNNFAAIGEWHPSKKAYRIWKDYIEE
jgi:hypothetical protein